MFVEPHAQALQVCQREIARHGGGTLPLDLTEVARQRDRSREPWTIRRSVLLGGTQDKHESLRSEFQSGLYYYNDVLGDFIPQKQPFTGVASPESGS